MAFMDIMARNQQRSDALFNTLLRHKLGQQNMQAQFDMNQKSAELSHQRNVDYGLKTQGEIDTGIRLRDQYINDLGPVEGYTAFKNDPFSPATPGGAAWFNQRSPGGFADRNTEMSTLAARRWGDDPANDVRGYMGNQQQAFYDSQDYVTQAEQQNAPGLFREFLLDDVETNPMFGDVSPWQRDSYVNELFTNVDQAGMSTAFADMMQEDMVQAQDAVYGLNTPDAPLAVLSDPAAYKDWAMARIRRETDLSGYSQSDIDQFENTMESIVMRMAPDGQQAIRGLMQQRELHNLVTDGEVSSEPDLHAMFGQELPEFTAMQSNIKRQKLLDGVESGNPQYIAELDDIVTRFEHNKTYRNTNAEGRSRALNLWLGERMGYRGDNSLDYLAMRGLKSQSQLLPLSTTNSLMEEFGGDGYGGGAAGGGDVEMRLFGEFQ
jgi:hypothetical protein